MFKKTLVSLLFLISVPALAIEKSYTCESLRKTYDGVPMVEIEITNSDYQGVIHFTLNNGGGSKYELDETVRWQSADAKNIARATSDTFELLLNDANPSRVTAVLLANEMSWSDQDLICQSH